MHSLFLHAFPFAPATATTADALQCNFVYVFPSHSIIATSLTTHATHTLQEAAVSIPLDHISDEAVVLTVQQGAGSGGGTADAGDRAAEPFAGPAGSMAQEWGGGGVRLGTALSSSGSKRGMMLEARRTDSRCGQFFTFCFVLGRVWSCCAATWSP
jgi:hypothetical protein